jgi:transcriptional regulator GlxA family with amidase domain
LFEISVNRVTRATLWFGLFTPHREGGQAQFVPVPMGAAAGGPDLEALRAWAVGHLSEPITVARLAAQLHMAPRTFARWFAARTGTAPHQWLTGQQLSRAQELLERTDRGVEQIAAECGLTPLMLRRHFAQRLAVTPRAYRRSFTQLAVHREGLLSAER